MLLKDLKINLKEAEGDPVLDADGNPIETPAEAPRKTVQQKELDKTTADGIGEEAFEMAARLAEYLQTSLPTIYNGITDIKSNGGSITIVNGRKATTKDGQLANSEEMVGIIQQLVQTEMKSDFDSFSIMGPTPAGSDLILSIIYNK